MKQRVLGENGKKIILVQVDPKFLVQSDLDIYYRNLEMKKREKLMDYTSMVIALQEGQKATRPSWDEGMYVWFAMNMVLHTHPYWPDQQKVWDQNGFPYVCEKDDATSDDWMLVGA